jgi:WD40 repeat protein
MEGHNYGVCCVSMSRDGAKIVSGSGDHDMVRVWDARTGTSIAVFAGPSFWVSCVAFSPDGSQIASGSRSESIIRVWDANTGAEIRTCGTRSLLPVQHLSFSDVAGHIHGQYQNGEVLSWDLAVSGQLKIKLVV